MSGAESSELCKPGPLKQSKSAARSRVVSRERDTGARALRALR